MACPLLVRPSFFHLDSNGQPARNALLFMANGLLNLKDESIQCVNDSQAMRALQPYFLILNNRDEIIALESFDSERIQARAWQRCEGVVSSGHEHDHGSAAR